VFPFWAMFLFVVCYLLGSLPFGQWVGQRHGIDLTQHGSGNTGAANAARALGLKGGLTVLGLDMAKGMIAVALAYLALMPGFVLHLTQVVFGFGAILGHNYSVFRRFKGGKGIATTFGVVLALNPKVALLAGLLWLGLVGLTRFSSVGSLGSTAAIPLLMVVYGAPWEYVVFGFAAAALAFLRHRENIERLTEGTENKIDF
jgi:acyl phosphate:glycerol-3-phosphate acyltransferase